MDLKSLTEMGMLFPSRIDHVILIAFSLLLNYVLVHSSEQISLRKQLYNL